MEVKLAFTLFLLIATVLAGSPKKSKDKAVEKSTESPEGSSETVDPKKLEVIDVDRGFVAPSIVPGNKTKKAHNKIIRPAFFPDLGIFFDILTFFFLPGFTPEQQLEDPPNDTEAIAANFTNEYTLLLNPLLGIFFDIAKLLEESDKKTVNATGSIRHKQLEEIAEKFEKEIEKLSKMDTAAQTLYVQEINFVNNLAKWTTVAEELLAAKEQEVLRGFDRTQRIKNNILEIEWEDRRLQFKLKVLKEDLKFAQDEIQVLKIECPVKFTFLVKAPPKQCIDEAHLKRQISKTEAALKEIQSERAEFKKLRIDEMGDTEAVHIQLDRMNKKYEEIFSLMQKIKRQSRLAIRLHQEIKDQADKLGKAIKGKAFSTKEVAMKVQETVKTLGPLVLETAEAPEVIASRRKYLSAIIEKVEKKLK